MQDAAGPMARLKAGDCRPGTLTRRWIWRLRLWKPPRQSAQARAKGVSLADQVGQRDMLGGGVSPQAEQILRAAYGPELSGRMSQDQFEPAVERLRTPSFGEQSTSATLFGRNLTADELLEGAAARYGKATGTEGQPPGASSARPVDGSGGSGGRGFVPGAGRETAPGVRRQHKGAKPAASSNSRPPR